MKGIVFREFIDMVESTFGEDISDEIIEESDLPSGGSYTASILPAHALLMLTANLAGCIGGCDASEPTEFIAYTEQVRLP